MLDRSLEPALRFIEAEILRTGGVSPSYAEIADAIGVRSKQTVHRIIKDLEKLGHLSVIPNRFRALTVIKPRIDRWLAFDPDRKCLVSLEEFREVRAVARGAAAGGD